MFVQSLLSLWGTLYKNRCNFQTANATRLITPLNYRWKSALWCYAKTKIQILCDYTNTYGPDCIMTNTKGQFIAVLLLCTYSTSL